MSRSRLGPENELSKLRMWQVNYDFVLVTKLKQQKPKTK